MRFRKALAGLAAAVIAATGFVTATPAQAATDVYSTPGVHLINGRYWQTTCKNYSTTVVRCTTDIFATKVFPEGGQWYKQNTWTFNNLSYLPSARDSWAGNPLGSTGSWTSSDGRQWRTECDTAATGRGACRNYIVATVASEVGGVVKQETKEVFNSMVRFSTSSVAPVTTIPAGVTGVTPPANGPKQPIGVTPRPAPLVSAPKPAPAPAPVAGAVRGSGNSCPSSHPIKGNEDSMIYHMRGQRFYNKTNPEWCFASQSDAMAAGYRKAKV